MGKKIKRLIARRGFSANGKDVVEGQDVTDMFDGQTLTVLRGMNGRIEEVEVDENEGVKEAKNRAVTGTKADAGAPALPGGLPGLPGA